MAKTKLFKKDLVRSLTESFQKASSTVAVDYTGMDVQAQQELKKRLKESESKMTVVKNTLLKIAGKEAKFPSEFTSDEVLSGQTALIYTDSDPISPLQTIGKFFKEFQLATFKAGVIEGEFQDKANLEKLSKLPGRDQLQAQVVGSIASPLYGIVRVLNANMQKLVFILNEHSKSEALNTKPENS